MFLVEGGRREVEGGSFTIRFTFTKCRKGDVNVKVNGVWWEVEGKRWKETEYFETSAPFHLPHKTFHKAEA